MQAMKNLCKFLWIIFIIFSLFKFLDYDSFLTHLSVALISKKIPFYANLYPFIETALGIAFDRMESTNNSFRYITGFINYF